MLSSLFFDFSQNYFRGVSMNSVERVKMICKERKIPISKLEKELCFGNGYISQLKKGTFPNDRLYKIAKYLDVDPEWLDSGKEKDVYSGDAIANLMYEKILEPLDHILPTDEEIQIIALYRKASSRDRALIDKILGEYK